MSHLIHVGIFTGGLVLGVAAGSAIVSRTGSGQGASQQPVPGGPPVPGKPASVPAQPGSQTVVDSGSPAASSAASIPYFSRDILKYSAAAPGPITDLLEHEAYLSAYDRRLRHPAWTAEHLNAASLLPPAAAAGAAQNVRGDRKNSVFKEDERVPELFRARLADYFRSGYDRGHMVPASDAKRSQKAMDETFLLTNIAPQVGEGFNRDYWAGTEEFVRSLTRKFSDLYVFTIPLYLPQPDPARPGKWRVTYEVIGNPPNVGVPTHFAKVVLAVDGPQNIPTPTASAASPAALPGPSSGSGAGTSFVGMRRNPTIALAAFVIPNAIVPNEVPLTRFDVDVEQVERAAGLNLFPPAIKSSAKRLCDLVKCDIIVRDFSDRNKQIAAGGQNQKYPPGSSSGRPQPQRSATF